MRKLLAIIMTATMLMISGVPMSAARECAMPMQGVHDMSGMHHQMADGDMEMQQQRHNPASAVAGYDEQIMAECCCSFHGLIDSLPHLLAPCMASETVPLAEAGSENSALYVETAWLARLPRIPLPPPESI